MKHTMIRYNKVPAGIEWIVIRGGKVIAEGVNSNIESARILAERSIVDAFNTEKMSTKVLAGSGDRQLSLVYSDK